MFYKIIVFHCLARLLFSERLTSRSVFICSVSRAINTKKKNVVHNPGYLKLNKTVAPSVRLSLSSAVEEKKLNNMRRNYFPCDVIEEARRGTGRQKQSTS